MDRDGRSPARIVVKRIVRRRQPRAVFLLCGTRAAAPGLFVVIGGV
jgi:hypothetical protein